MTYGFVVVMGWAERIVYGFLVVVLALTIWSGIQMQENVLMLIPTVFLGVVFLFGLGYSQKIIKDIRPIFKK